MIEKLVRQAGLGMLTLLAISVTVFGVTQALPGDIAQQLLGVNATPEKLAQVRESLGLDRPLALQYWDWLSGLFAGNFGLSLANGLPVADLMGPRLVNTAVLALLSLAITLPLCFFLGTFAALHRDGWLDKSLLTVTTIISGIPEFVLGILLVAVVTLGGLNMFPPVSNLDPQASVWQQLHLLALPAATLVLTATPLLARMVRTTVSEQLDSDYIVAGRLNGLSTFTLVARQALPNAFAPLIQSTALTIRYLVAGVVMVEVVFSYPGMGLALINAVQIRDLPTVQFIALALAAIIVLANVLADLLSILATPKLRTALR